MGSGKGKSRRVQSSVVAAEKSQRLKLTIPGREQGFRQIKGPYGTLVLPSSNKQTWQIDERVFRSLILDDKGQIISSGFPKFANLNERGFTDHFEDLKTALTHGKDIWLTEKVDGSLIIRSVVAGQIIWRTRGAWGLGQFEEPVMAQVAQHSELSDPEFMPGHSLLRSEEHTSEL